MCDVKHFDSIYKEFKNLSVDDYIELISSTEDDEKKDFYISINNVFLANNQKKVIAKGIY